MSREPATPECRGAQRHSFTARWFDGKATRATDASWSFDAAVGENDPLCIVNGHSKFPHLRSSKIPHPLVEDNDEMSACGGCGQAVCGLSKALWARLRVHIAGSVHRLPPLTLPLWSA